MWSPAVRKQDVDLKNFLLKKKMFWVVLNLEVVNLLKASVVQTLSLRASLSLCRIEWECFEQICVSTDSKVEMLDLHEHGLHVSPSDPDDEVGNNLKNDFQSIKDIQLLNSIKAQTKESWNPFSGFGKEDTFLAGSRSFMGEVMERGHVEKPLVQWRWWTSVVETQSLSLPQEEKANLCAIIISRHFPGAGDDSRSKTHEEPPGGKKSIKNRWQSWQRWGSSWNNGIIIERKVVRRFLTTSLENVYLNHFLEPASGVQQVTLLFQEPLEEQE